MQTALKIAFGMAAGLSGALAAHATEGSADSLSAAVASTKLIIDTRLRLEEVDQDPMTNKAEAVTLRARLGFETGKLWDTSLLAEGEFVWPWKSDYNSTTNGNTTYPTVADPESYEFNRLQLSNTSLPQTTVTLGRQRIGLDDQRFIGNVGWRQNEQTYDSLRVVNTSLPHWTFDVAYINQVNRVFGKESPQGRYEGNSYVANASYEFPIGKLSAFGYWLEFDPIANVPAAAGDSSQTYGARFAGEYKNDKWKLGYAASYASQQEYGENPLTFDNDYYLLELIGTYDKYSLGAGVESLAGDGTKGFATPLATLHKFQGWADKFLTTPVDGVEDKYVNATMLFKKVGPLETLSGTVSYHQFDAERTSIDYGSEINLQVQAKWQKFQATVKYADYAADRLFTDTTKFWVQLEYIW
ncbi:MAG TPA: hypothetical protein VIT67_12335 [Povalibacter sp.]